MPEAQAEIGKRLLEPAKVSGSVRRLALEAGEVMPRLPEPYRPETHRPEP